MAPLLLGCGATPGREVLLETGAPPPTSDTASTLAAQDRSVPASRQAPRATIAGRATVGNVSASTTAPDGAAVPVALTTPVTVIVLSAGPAGGPTTAATSTTRTGPATSTTVRSTTTTSGSVSSTTTSRAGTTTTSSTTPATVELRTRSRGSTVVVVDAADVALYVSLADPPGVSTCDDTCAQTWIPLSGSVTGLAPGIDPERIGTVTGSGGTVQLTYYGRPLYRHRDEPAGSATGQGVDSRWYLVEPDGDPVTA